MSTTEAKGHGGRPVDSFVNAHFTKLRKLDSSSKKWIYQCKYCKAEVTHRENNCADHISEACNDAKEEFRVQALHKLRRGNNKDDNEILQCGPLVQGDGKTDLKKRKLSDYLEKPLEEKTAECIDQRLLRFIVHANIPFSAVDDEYFQAFLYLLRPMYEPPSRLTLAHYTLKSEAARVRLINIDEMKARTGMTLLCDGWEDAAGRSIYATAIASVGTAPIILGLTDMSGQRATAENILKLVQFFAKGATKTAMRLVSFFNRSHYWGGKLREFAAAEGVKRGLTVHTESRWYALVLMLLSVRDHRRAMRQLVNSIDASVSNGQSSLPTDIVNTIERDFDFWELTNQFIRTCKPLVDLIGILESRDTSLVDCSVELMKTAYHMEKLERCAEDNLEFYIHAQLTFSRNFETLNTDLHFLALFFHPSYRRLASLPAACARNFEDVRKLVTGMAKKWKWKFQVAQKLLQELDIYKNNRAPFDGASTSALEWWNNVPLNTDDSPLKCFALTLLQLTPHAADIERLFSNLGSIHSPRRAKLGVPTMERLGRVRAHLQSVLKKKIPVKSGKPRRTNARIMRAGTASEDTIQQMEREFCMETVLTTNDELAESETSGIMEMEAAMGRMEEEQVPVQVVAAAVASGGTTALPNLTVLGLRPSDFYNFEELRRIIKGQVSYDNDDYNIQKYHGTQMDGEEWNVDDILVLPLSSQ